jgi:hypothetical protein
MKKVYDDKTINLSQSDFEKPEGKLTIELDCSKYNNAQQNDGNAIKFDL